MSILIPRRKLLKVGALAPLILCRPARAALAVNQLSTRNHKWLIRRLGGTGSMIPESANCESGY